MNSHLGNGFGVEPTLTQTAYFRPHNRSEDIDNLYLVGANTQPGAGTPAVMMSAKITARTVWEDHRERLSSFHHTGPGQPNIENTAPETGFTEQLDVEVGHS